MKLHLSIVEKFSWLAAALVSSLLNGGEKEWQRKCGPYVPRLFMSIKSTYDLIFSSIGANMGYFLENIGFAIAEQWKLPFRAPNASQMQLQQQ